MRAAALVLLLFVVAAAALSGWEMAGPVTLQPWQSGVTISLRLWEVLAASFVLGVLVAISAVSVLRTLDRSAGWMGLLCAYLVALLVLVGMHGDAASARTLTAVGLGILAGGALWQAIPFLELAPAYEARLRIGSMCVLGVLVGSALLGEALVLRTILALAFGAGALWVGYQAFLSLRAGGVVETESRFGGLGGGLGGWRLSQSTSLLLLTMVLAGAAVLLGRPDAKPEAAATRSVEKPNAIPEGGAAKAVEKKPENPVGGQSRKGAETGSGKPGDAKNENPDIRESGTRASAPSPEKKEEKPASAGATGGAMPAPTKP